MPSILGQIWGLLRLCVTGPGGRRGLLYLVIVLALELAGIQLTLRLVQWTADFYNALEKVDVEEALHQLGVFALITASSATLYLVGTYVRKLLQIRWRRSLTNQALDRWLSGKAYWHLKERANEADTSSRKVIDNPDQRIADDCRIFVERVLTEALDVITGVVALVSYVALLWSLSTFPLAFSLFGFAIEIPRYMVWAAPLYVALCSGLTHLLGAPLKGLLFEQQRREADFRFGLARLRENADAVALSDGEPAERRLLDRRFDGILSNWRRLIGRELLLGCFMRPYMQSVLRIPLFLALPAYLAGHVTLGGLMQVGMAFSNVVTTLSWFIFSYRDLSELAATTTRLYGFLQRSDEAAARAPAFSAGKSGDGSLTLAEVTLRSPDGRSLLALPELAFKPGEAVWINAPSGFGKSSFLKALAGLWPHGSGRLRLPPGRLAFLPQQPYLPLGELAAAATYPRDPAELPRPALDRLLQQVGLGHRAAAGEDAAGLSVGEQQRLALLRLLVLKPDWVFLDEATSALDSAAEAQLLSLLRTALPQTTFILVAHREPQGLGPLRRIDLDRLSLAKERSSLAS